MRRLSQSKDENGEDLSVFDSIPSRPYWGVHGRQYLVSKLVYNLLMGLITYLARGYLLGEVWGI